jgi:hypothetical protein
MPDTQRHQEQQQATGNPRQSPVSLFSVSASAASTHTGSQEVTGSIPVSSTNGINILQTFHFLHPT